MWAGVDSVWEQKKLEDRKMLENRAESPASSARFVGQVLQDRFKFELAPLYRWAANGIHSLLFPYFPPLLGAIS
jgi:hypothetical protein